MVANKLRMDSIEEELRDAFRVFDKNNDGIMTSNELRDVMLTLGDTMSREDVDEMIRDADLNGDGNIDYEGMLR